MGTKYAWVGRTQPVTRVASRGRSLLADLTFVKSIETTISESMVNSHREKVFISGKRSHERRGHFPIW